MIKNIYRGEVYYADLSPTQGSEQGGRRPVLIVQNDIGNRYAPTTIILPLTTATTKKPLPTHILIPSTTENGLADNSTALAEQVKIIDKSRLKKRLGAVSEEIMAEVDKAVRISLGV